MHLNICSRHKKKMQHFQGKKSGEIRVNGNPHKFIGSLGTHCTADVDSNGGQTF